MIPTESKPAPAYALSRVEGKLLCCLSLLLCMKAEKIDVVNKIFFQGSSKKKPGSGRLRAVPAGTGYAIPVLGTCVTIRVNASPRH